MSESLLLRSSRLRAVTTSSTLRDVTRDRDMSRTLEQMSGLGEEMARRTSIRTSWRTLLCFFLRSSSLSSMMSLTLLSACVVSRLEYVCAAALTAVGLDDNDTSVQAASYDTDAEDDESIWKRTRTKRDLELGSRRHTLRVSSRTRRAKPSPNFIMSSTFCEMNSMAMSSAELKSMRKALRRAHMSVSARMNLSMSSAPSGMSFVPKRRKQWKTHRAAFLRT
mmetsp:Transcript_15070/g.30004  ORF Transcript_15070/g.30004 Transcript_15070/m.30004 type:complete len:222 (-) Transcript_15070:515-1180(-)